MSNIETLTFDDIIVSARSAGAVAANRLFENPKHKVLLSEAGLKSNPWTRLPIWYVKTMENPIAN